MFNRILLAAIMAIALNGCSATRQAQSPESGAYLADASRQSLSIPVGKDRAEELWARAQIWISEHSRMRLGMVTDYVIQTETPSERKPDYQYSVTKAPSPEGFTITVRCTTEHWVSKKQADQNAQLLAYYIATGRPTPADLVH